MSGLTRYVAGLFAAAGLLLTAAHAGAETATLELKRVDTSPRPDSGEVPIEHLFRISRPQTVFQPLGEQEGMFRGPHDDDTPAFSDVVKKEPAEYTTKTPLRGVVQLGSHHYGFVLDVAAPKKAKEEPPAENKEEERGGLFSALGRALTAPLTRKPEAQSQAPNFTRLHFDLNRNGDLTDDGVIEAEAARVFSPSTSHSTFPVVELTIDVDGKKVAYAFVLSVRVHASEHLSYAYASLNAAAYRDGEITLDGQKRRVVLVDFNSNGRFDDPFRVEQSPDLDGDVYPVVGDMLYIDPQPVARYRSPYDPTTSADQYQVSGLIGYGGRFFDMEIGGGGETLSLTPSALPVGYAANLNHGVRAIVHGEHGVLEIAFDETGKAMLPEGTWRLLSYTIVQQAEAEGESEPEEADAGPPRRPPARPTMVSARAGQKAKAARIADGKTTPMTFGPPFTPQVTASPSHRDDETVSLTMSLVGAGGEVCSSMVINGGRPPQPEFTISTKDGEEVASGKFAYG